MAQTLVLRRPRSGEVVAKRVKDALKEPKVSAPEGVQPLAAGYFSLESMRIKTRAKNAKKAKLRQ